MGLWYWLRRLKSDIFLIYYALRDPRVPGQAKTLLFLLLAYIISPIDLVPDLFFPFLGYVDDLVLIPLGVEFALKTIPEPIVSELRNKAGRHIQKAKNWAGSAILAVILLIILILMYRFLHL